VKKIAIFTVICGLVSLFVITRCNFAGDVSLDPRYAARQLLMGQYLIAADKPVIFYGKISDKDNTPIEGATIFASVRRSTGHKYIARVSDINGRFEISGESGNLLYIDKIEKTGYEFNLQQKGVKQGFLTDGSFVADTGKPIVYIGRKKEPPTVVIPGKISVMYAKDVKFYEVDLKQMVDDKPFGLERYHGDNAHADIKTRVEYSSVDDSYTFILETPDADSGIIAFDQMLYALPEAGYKTPFKINVPNNQAVSTVLYVKSRGGQLFSRLETKFAIEKEKVYFAAKVLTNPLGERNVDSDSGKYKEYLDKQDAEAKRMGPRAQ
jgi:hypothetical protein